MSLESVETILAYTAGIVDGEGSIYMKRSAPGRSHGYSIFLRVGVTSGELIHWLIVHFGGWSEPAMLPGNRKPLWRWALYGEAAAALLQRLLPYLVIKRRQAELVIDFYSVRNPRRQHLSEDEKERRARICSELHRLNHRGVA